MQLIETLRTKEELIEYLTSQSLDASDEAIESLKEQYKNNEINTSNLNLQQLESIAGGALHKALIEYCKKNYRCELFHASDQFHLIVAKYEEDFKGEKTSLGCNIETFKLDRNCMDSLDKLMQDEKDNAKKEISRDEYIAKTLAFHDILDMIKDSPITKDNKDMISRFEKYVAVRDAHCNCSYHTLKNLAIMQGKDTNNVLDHYQSYIDEKEGNPILETLFQQTIYRVYSHAVAAYKHIFGDPVNAKLKMEKSSSMQNVEQNVTQQPLASSVLPHSVPQTKSPKPSTTDFPKTPTTDQSKFKGFFMAYVYEACNYVSEMQKILGPLATAAAFNNAKTAMNPSLHYTPLSNQDNQGINLSEFRRKIGVLS